MEYIKVTNENIEKEHICCAISNNNDIQVSSKNTKPRWLNLSNTICFNQKGRFNL